MSKKNKRAKKGNHLEEKDLRKVTGGMKTGGDIYDALGVKNPFDNRGAIAPESPSDKFRGPFKK